MSLKRKLQQAELSSPKLKARDRKEPDKPEPMSELLTFRPFPVEVLPEPLRAFIKAGAMSICCDPSYLALPLLTACGAAIGNTRRFRIKDGWDAPPILWTAIIGESGTAKTPAFGAATKAVHDRQGRAFERHAESSTGYENELAQWEKDHAEWKRDKHAKDDPPPKPEMPNPERFIVSDTTIEALAPILQANPRGLLLARDELSGWFGSFDRYAGKGKGGSDSANWLSMYNAGSVPVDRKSNGGQTIYIRNAAVSITGGIQPGILQRVLAGEHTESGLAARFLLSYPPRKPKRYSEEGIDEKLQDRIARLIDRLYTLQFGHFDGGQNRPELIRMNPTAKALWVANCDAHNQEQVELTGALSAAWSKLEEIPARLALILHLIKWSATGMTTPPSDTIDDETLKAAITLTEWFKHEARRVYAEFAETETEGDQRKLIEWIERKGGSVTARDAQQGYRPLKDSGLAEPALEALVKAGWGAWEPSHGTGTQGGRPSRNFKLFDLPASTKLDNRPATEGFVDVDNVDAHEISSEIEVDVVQPQADDAQHKPTPKHNGGPKPGCLFGLTQEQIDASMPPD